MRCVLLAALLSVSPLAAEVPVPRLEGRVTDLTATLSQAELQSIAGRLDALEKQKGAQVVVLLVPTTGGESIEQFSMRVAESWKIGRKGVDDGVILVLAKEDRKLRIEVGYGLEGALTDALTNQIIREQMVPRLKQDQYGPAIEAGVESIALVIEGEALPPPDPGAADEVDLSNPGWKVMLLLLGFGGIFWVVGIAVTLIHHRLLPLLPLTGGLTAFSLALFWGGAPWLLAYIAGGAGAFVLGVLTVLFGSAFRGGSGGTGSSSGSSSRSFSSGSGFSGRGGSFGGGGSSGSW